FLVDLAATAIACDSLGLMEAMLEATVAYAKARQQFGRPIGSFQAVQHACADMLVAVQVSRALVAQAVDAVASGAPAQERRAAVSRAKSHVGSSAVEVCGKAVQLHGGVGYTWESGIHAYLKRATLNRVLFGSPEEHRRRLTRSVPGPPSC
ncbi:MAG TPA: acyl-CoA dehydrogenase family protein, partial [Acidimicrobiales bacterium]|nr:acyl-CoA dehydrogenase family protein [Acidimicrobiales bacterium]